MKIPCYVKDDYYGCAAEGLWKAVQKYNDSLDFVNFAITYIRNEIRDERRRNLNKGRNDITVISMSNEDIQREAENRFPESFVNNLILRCDFEKNIRLSNNRDKEIIAMKYQGFTNAEIGKELNISESLVRKRLKYIKRVFEEVI